MRVVLDEGVPKQLAEALRRRGLDADRFDKAWRGATNGALLALVEEAGYDVLLTADKNIVHQQKLGTRRLAVVALPLNRRLAIMARVDDIADTISRTSVSQHVSIGLDGRRTVHSIVDGTMSVAEFPEIEPFAA